MNLTSMPKMCLLATWPENLHKFLSILGYPTKRWFWCRSIFYCKRGLTLMVFSDLLIQSSQMWKKGGSLPKTVMVLDWWSAEVVYFSYSIANTLNQPQFCDNSFFTEKTMESIQRSSIQEVGTSREVPFLIRLNNHSLTFFFQFPIAMCKCLPWDSIMKLFNWKLKLPSD
jgi:hypothetical protein